MLAFGQRSLVEILEWSGLHTRPGGGRFGRTFEITVVILVQAANGQLRCALEKLILTHVAAGVWEVCGVPNTERCGSKCRRISRGKRCRFQ
jgi:hypothetical protein